MDAAGAWTTFGLSLEEMAYAASPIERLRRPLDYEAVYLHEIADVLTARRVIGQWIGFCNTQGPHAALGGTRSKGRERFLSPAEMRRLGAALARHRDERPLYGDRPNVRLPGRMNPKSCHDGRPAIA